MKKDSSVEQYKYTEDILRDMCKIIESSRASAYQAVNIALVRRNWLLGQRIAEEELKGEGRAEYGLEIIKNLSKELTREYGKGFTKTNLYSFYQFFKTFPEIFHSVSGKSGKLLTWTHYRTLLWVKDDKARDVVRERSDGTKLDCTNIATEYRDTILLPFVGFTK